MTTPLGPAGVAAVDGCAGLTIGFDGRSRATQAFPLAR